MANSVGRFGDEPVGLQRSLPKVWLSRCASSANPAVSCEGSGGSISAQSGTGAMERSVATAAAKLLVGPVCAGVGLASQVVHNSINVFPAMVKIRQWVQFDVSGEQEEDGEHCQKSLHPKRKDGNGSSSPGRSVGPSLWGACVSDCICCLGRRVATGGL